MDESAGTEAVAVERERYRDRKHVNENVKVVPPSPPKRENWRQKEGGN